MRVICIENSLLVDNDNPDFGSICTHKGSVYHVIRSVEGQKLREERGVPFALGPWYEFLEVKGLHHHVRFLEIPDDDIESEIEKTYSQVATRCCGKIEHQRS